MKNYFKFTFFAVLITAVAFTAMYAVSYLPYGDYMVWAIVVLFVLCFPFIIVKLSKNILK